MPSPLTQKVINSENQYSDLQYQLAVEYAEQSKVLFLSESSKLNIKNRLRCDIGYHTEDDYREVVFMEMLDEYKALLEAQKPSYTAGVLYYVGIGCLSNCEYEIDRYLSIFQELQKKSIAETAKELSVYTVDDLDDILENRMAETSLDENGEENVNLKQILRSKLNALYKASPELVTVLAHLMADYDITYRGDSPTPDVFFVLFDLIREFGEEQPADADELHAC